MKRNLLLISFLLFSLIAISQEEARLLRFPTIHGNSIVFTYAGNLYTVNANGGIARRLTNDVGFEMFARFSPDGKTLAFTGQYDGNTEVYTMPAYGGTPKRLTYTATLGRDDVADRMGPNNIVFGWKHDNKTILFRSRKKTFNPFNGQLYAVNIDGSMPEELPVPRSGFCSFSPDDSKMAYNRIFREFRTWKRYRGGMADDIWIYNFKTNKVENITNNKAQDIIPMWHGNKIYYISDKGKYKRMNLYVYDTSTKQTQQLTDYKDFDIKFPSLGDKNIVYENGGYIYKFNLTTNKAEKVKIIIAEDMLGSRKELKNVSKEVRGYDVSPNGKRAVFCAHGEIFNVPQKSGKTINLSQSSGVHERNPKWSPDGKFISFIADKTGEDEIYIQAEDGSKAAEQITTKGTTYKYHTLWSPDSKKIMWADRHQKLHYVDINTKKIVEIDKDPRGEIRNYSWSPDSKWLVYTKTDKNHFNQLYLYSLAQKKSFAVTDNWYHSSNGVFSSDGKYLFFKSSRDFNPTFSNTELDAVFNNMSKIYYLTLSKSTDALMKPQNDEVGNETPTENKLENDENSVKAEVKNIKVDIDGIQNRIEALPITNGSYFGLSAAKNKLYYLRNSKQNPVSQMFIFDFESRKETCLGKISGYVMSANENKMLVSQNGSFMIIDLPIAKIEGGKSMNLSGMQTMIDKKAEWAQIYNEAWRQMREFFYDPNMHGVDWKAECDKYAPLLKYVNHRSDLNYIIGELISELNIGHAYVGGGQRPDVKRIKMGLLGAELSKDKSGYFKIDKILKGENWRNAGKSPLSAIGVYASEGDYIVSINGKSTKDVKNIYELLINTAGKQTDIGINSKPTAQGSHNEVVVPIADEATLYYLKYVNGNIEKVNKATNGRVGYVHIPDMGVGGLNEFVKRYYPQLTKEALIVDVRGNGGGFVSPIVIERLRRVASQINKTRNMSPSVNRDGTMNGPLVMLCDEFSASDGDIVNYRFRFHKLGTIIGKRTWGGVVGIRNSLPFIDGGTLHKPEFSRYDIEGKKWIMEGVGVTPDIEIDNEPYLEYTGTDQQLNKAIEVILNDLKTKGKKIPAPPAYPKR